MARNSNSSYNECVGDVLFMIGHTVFGDLEIWWWWWCCCMCMWVCVCACEHVIIRSFKLQNFLFYFFTEVFKWGKILHFLGSFESNKSEKSGIEHIISKSKHSDRRGGKTSYVKTVLFRLDVLIAVLYNIYSPRFSRGQSQTVCSWIDPHPMAFGAV